MAYSYVQYTGNGATVLFSIPFEYISADYLEVRVDGVLSSAYTLPTSASLQMNVAPSNGAILEIRRNTPKTSRLVDFQDASILTEASLDLDSDQAFHITQEAMDFAEETGAEAVTAAALAANISAVAADASADAAAISETNAAASAVLAATFNPALYQPIDDQLTTLAGITAQQASDLTSVTTYIGDLLDDANEETARATLGVHNLAGIVAYFAYSVAPTGWLKANGAAVNRTTYARLFAAIGTTFGVGDGSTTFNVPDLRGEFVRGWDDAKGVDSGRVYGSSQTDALKTHNHDIAMYQATSSSTGCSNGPQMSSNPYCSDSASYVKATGGTETRPRNVALLACIKY